MSGNATFRRVKQVGIIPTIRTSNSSRAIEACRAILDGGLAVVEVSLAMHDALRALEATARALGSEMVVGAGTVVDGAMARRAIEAGAQFLVTPGFSPEVIEVAAKSNVAVFAGALTPTEVQLAGSSGANAVKLFPCSDFGGARYLRAVKSQYLNFEFIASGGVTLENCVEYFHAGAIAIGVGAAIADTESIDAGNHRVFTVRARRFRKVVSEAQERWGGFSSPVEAAG